MIKAVIEGCLQLSLHSKPATASKSQESRLSRFLFTLLVLVVCLNWASRSAHAQGATAVLTGAVQDVQGARVGEADVELLQLDRGFRRDVKTDSQGIFTVVALPPGRYVLSARRADFKPTVIRNITLNVNANLELLVTLKIADEKQTVTVVDRPELTSTSGAVSNVTDREFIQELPLNGRSIQSLITLSPGITAVPVSSGNPGQFSVDGMRSNANYFTVDGVSANFGAAAYAGSAGLNDATSGSTPSTDIQGGFSNLVSIDALQEFSIQTSTFAPEFGRSPGAQISLVTRGGELKFHGAAYEYFRNDALDATNYFSKYLQTGKQALRYNDFGGVFGGPIFVPGRKNHGKDFFFFSYEGARLRLPQAAVTTVVPSAASRAAATTTVTQRILNAFPIPTTAYSPITSSSGALTGGQFYSSGYSNPSSNNVYGLRLDHKFTDRFTIFARYNRANSRQQSRGTADLATLTYNKISTDTLTIGSTQTLTPHLVNQFTINASSQRSYAASVQDTFGGAQPLPVSFFTPGGNNCSGCGGTVSIRGLGGSASTLSSSISLNNPTASKNRQINWVDSVSYDLGHHQLKFGVDDRYISPISAPQSTVIGQYFLNMATFLTQTSYLDLVVYQPAFASVFKSFSAYAQDTWRVNNKFTLTYGTRWELDPAPSGKNGKYPRALQSLNLNTIDFTYLALAPAGTPLYPTIYSNFAPRVGFSYLFGAAGPKQTVLRGGLGTFYDTGQNGFGQISFPYTKSYVIYGSLLGGTGALPGYPTLSFPIDAAYATQPATSDVPSASNPVSLTAAAPNYRLPRAYEWNLTLEQSLGANSVFSLGYVASSGQQLQQKLSYSFVSSSTTVPFSTNFSGLTVLTNQARSGYNSLQAQFHSRVNRSLEAMVNYTWSHSVDNSSDDTFRSTVGNPRIDRGDSSFDIRNSFNGALTYHLPSSVENRFLGPMVNHWSLNSIVSAHGALPFNVYSYSDASAATGGSYSLRANIDPTVSPWIYESRLNGSGGLVPGGKRLNPAAFTSPATGVNGVRQGTLRRNLLRGFNAYQIDLGVHRSFPVYERLNLQFRAELFNILNHANFADPGMSGTNYVTYPNPGTSGYPLGFGESNELLSTGYGGGGNTGGFNPLFQSGGPRAVQFTLRAEF